jgi:LmbE family N-acetylglucosaminyl deacetylase
LGDCGSVELSAEEIRSIRHLEAGKACEVLGATYHHPEFDDLCIFNDDNSNRRVTALLREVAGDYAFAQRLHVGSRDDQHPCSKRLLLYIYTAL